MSVRDALTAGRARRTGFRDIALVTAATTYALIVVGGVVRATDSGDACPDWPRCKGELIPPLETSVLIEFSHRLLATVVGLLVVATVVAAWRTQRHRPVVLWGTVVALGLLIAQVILGGVTVLSDLPANLVTAHLAVASVLLATLVVSALASTDAPLVGTPELRARAGAVRNVALGAAVAVFVLMMTGSYVTGSGASLAFDDWPLFNGSLLPSTGRLAVIHATHRFTAVVVGLVLIATAVYVWREAGWHRGVVAGMVGAAALYVAQVFAGAANVWTLLQPSAIAAHLALAVAVWVVLVTVTVVAHLSGHRLPERETVDGRGIAAAQAEGAASGGVSAGGPS